MKKLVLVLLVISLIAIVLIIRGLQPDVVGGNITISGAFALYPMVVKWAEEFKKVNPNVTFDISAGGAGKGMTDVLVDIVDIGLVSREVWPEELKKGAFPIAVTKDAVVPTISTSHPQLQQILLRGIKKSEFIEIFITGNYTAWSDLPGVNFSAPIHVYTRSDAAGAPETWAKYLGKKQEDLLGVAVFGDPGLAQAVKHDPLGIGFNNIVYVFDSKTRQPTNGIHPIPIDLNSNGHIDAEESFYTSMDTMIEAISRGKYPSPPSRDLYFVTNGKPTKKIVVEFIQWVLVDGQQFVHEAGYVNLSEEEIEAELQKIK